MADTAELDYLGVFTQLDEQLEQRSQVVNPWKEFFLEGKYAEAACEIQSVLSSDNSSLEAKLWWIEAERYGGVVPLSALCSPLEEIVEKVAEDKTTSLLLLTSSVCLGLGAALVEKGQTRLAVLLLRRAFALSVSSNTLSKEEQILLRDAFVMLVNDELGKAKIRQEKRAYIDDLQDEENTLRKFKPVVIVQPKESVTNVVSDDNPLEEFQNIVPEARKQKSAGLSSKVILQQAAESFKNSEANKHNEVASETPRALFAFLHNLSSSHYYALIAVSLYIVVYEYYRRPDPSEIFIAAPILRSFEDDLILPRVFLMPMSASSLGDKAMESIRDRIENAKDRTNSQNKEKQKEEESKEQIDKEAMRMAADATRSQKQPKNEIVQVEKDEREVLMERTPPLNSSRLGQMKVEDIGSSEQKISIDKLHIAPDGRRYGPSPTSKYDTAIDPNSKQQVEAYEVKQFDPSKIYHVVNDTNVLSAPSAVSVEVGKLRTGDKIEVVSSMGPWLELRSARGKRGYVYAQDASEK